MHEEEQSRRRFEPMLIGGRRTAAPEPSDLDEQTDPDEAIELEEDESSSYSSMGTPGSVQQPEAGQAEQDVVAASGVPAPEPESM